MIRRKALGYTYGLMEGSMKECGLMGNSTERVNSIMLRAKVKEDCGKMENVSNGLTRKMFLVEVKNQIIQLKQLQTKIMLHQIVTNSKLLIFDSSN